MNRKAQLLKRLTVYVYTPLRLPGGGFIVYSSFPTIPSPASSTFCSRAAIILLSHLGTGAPSAPAFSMILPASVRIYQITTSGHSSTV